MCMTGFSAASQELDALPAESDDGTGIEATLQHGGVRLALEMESCGIDGYSWLHKASKTCAMVMYVVSSEEGFILKQVLRLHATQDRSEAVSYTHLTLPTILLV